MSLLFGYLSNDFSLVNSAFAQVEDTILPSIPTGSLDWGVGYVQNSQVLLRKKANQAAEDFRLGEQIADLRSHSIVGVASEPCGARSGVDMPPYRFRRWLMAHTGECLNIEPFRRRLLYNLPDYVASGIRGSHPSEVLLHFVIERVRRASDSANLTLAPQRAARALAEAVAKIRRLARESGAESPPVQNYLLTNGSILLASCSGATMRYTTLEGIFDDPVMRTEPLFAGHRPKRIDHPTFRAAFFASGLVGDADVWLPMADYSVAYVDRHNTVQIDGIDEILSVP